MDSILQSFLSYQFLLATFAIAGINFVLRKLTEFIINNFLNANIFVKKLWNDLALPISPLVTGGVFGFFVTNFAFPVDIKSVSSRVAFGIVAGMFSGLVYRVTKSLLKQKLSETDLKDELTKEKSED